MSIRFYKKEYLIAVYDTDDNLVGICDNVKEFAQLYKKDRDIAESIISRIATGRRKAFFHEGKRLTIFLIPLDPQEILELKKEERIQNAR